MPQRILITAEAPLAFPPRKPDTQFSQSLGYVPGIALWGALGEQLQRTPQARFAHALPARANDSWVRVLPATAMSCKRLPGFTQVGDGDKPQHGVFDTLIDRACWEELRPAAFTYDPHCPTCLGRPDAFAGCYALHADAPARYQKREVAQRLLTRVAIDRRRGTAAEGQLYSPLAIAELTAYERTRAEQAADDGEKQAYEPTSFLGLAWGLTEAERAALEDVQVLGARRSSGLGQVRIKVQDVPAADDLAARLHAFNTMFRARWALMQAATPTGSPGWAPGDQAGEWTLFSVGLQTDAVLLEDGWRPSTTLSAAQLAEATGLAAEPVRAWASARVVGGWNIRWNRHRPTVLTVLAGATYLFRTQASAADVIAALGALEEQGAGQRRAEGYGVVRCCDEFHVQAIGAAV
jgi:CRISPR-associated protein Csx10